MKIVFDLDDTICTTRNRDYENSVAIKSVAKKIKELREKIPNAEIVVHTSRGMSSCKGDALAAERKNKPQILSFLSANGIVVDEIVFGKPLADIYVDDKAMTAQDFANADIQEYSGFSGARITRIGGVVIKEGAGLQHQADWYAGARNHYPKRCVSIPKVYSYTLGKLYMEYIDGVPAYKVVNEVLIKSFVRMCSNEPTTGENDVDAYVQYIEERVEFIGLKSNIGTRLRACGNLRRRTFCHGDLSLQNILIRKDGGVALIDPSPKEFMQTWLLDVAKLRASLTILDETIVGVTHSQSLVDVLDREVGVDNLDVVRLIEESHVIRVWYYAKKLGKKKEEHKLQEYYGTHYGK